MAICYTLGGTSSLLVAQTEERKSTEWFRAEGIKTEVGFSSIMGSLALERQKADREYANTTYQFFGTLSR